MPLEFASQSSLCGEKIKSIRRKSDQAEIRQPMGGGGGIRYGVVVSIALDYWWNGVQEEPGGHWGFRRQEVKQRGREVGGGGGGGGFKL